MEESIRFFSIRPLDRCESIGYDTNLVPWLQLCMVVQHATGYVLHASCEAFDVDLKGSGFDQRTVRFLGRCPAHS